MRYCRIVYLLVISALGASLLAGCQVGAPTDTLALADIRLAAVLPVPHRSHRDGMGQVIALVNTGASAHDVGGWEVGNATLAQLPGHLLLHPGERLYLAADSDTFARFWGRPADFRFAGTPGTVPVLGGARPVLKAAGDVVRMLDPSGQQVDVLAYGNVNPPFGWQGEPVQVVDSFPLVPDNQVVTRLHDPTTGRYRTGASAADWSGGTRKEPGRVYYAGQTDLPPLTTRGAARVTGVAAPDNAASYLLQLIDGARQELKLVSYEMTDEIIGQHLVDAVKRGVDVTVVLEHDPVGGLRDADKQLHAALAHQGVHMLYLWDFAGDFSSRYNMYHNKYVLIDHKAVLVTSGNLTHSSFPEDETCGNREWSVLVENPTVVAWYEALYAADVDPTHHPDIRAFSDQLDPFSPPLPYTGGPCWPYTWNKTHDNRPVAVTGDLQFELTVSPDSSLSRDAGILGAIRRAQHRILQSQQYIDKWWGKGSLESSPDPLLQELVAAARRGVQVEILLDYSNAKDASSPTGQVALYQYVQELHQREGLPIEVRLINMSGSGIGRTYHNKSLVIDDDTVIISSINGSENSFRYARETALRVTGSKELTAYFAGLFAHDWDASSRPNAPGNLVVQPRYVGAALQWVPNLEPEVTGYRVEYRAGDAGAWHVLRTVKTPGLLVPQEHGQWAVIALKADGRESDRSVVSR